MANNDRHCIETICHSCGQHVDFPQEAIDKESACPRCGEIILIRRTPPIDKNKVKDRVLLISTAFTFFLIPIVLILAKIIPEQHVDSFLKWYAPAVLLIAFGYTQRKKKGDKTK
jgi:DNA-directed RNA polymerase subunit RPC12/RpoP